MAWRPRWIAFATRTALQTMLVALVLCLVARSLWTSACLSVAVFVSGGLTVVLLLVWWRSVALVCLLPAGTTANRVGEGLRAMSLTLVRNGPVYVIGSSQITVKVVSLLGVSGVVVSGGGTAARRFIAEVLFKHIRYPGHDVEEQDGRV